MRIDHYDWPGGRETILRFGPETGPVVVAALPLLEEANRTRAFAVTILRALAVRGIAGALPDLPGTGESMVPTTAMTLADLRAGFAAAAGRRGCAVTLAIRSGALIDRDARVAGRWLLAPQTGNELLREWERLLRLSADGEPRGFQPTIAGNRVAPALVDALMGARPAHAAPTRTIRLTGDPRPADVVLAGPPLWRRAEPDNAPAFARQLADDIADWIATCAG